MAVHIAPKLRLGVLLFGAMALLALTAMSAGARGEVARGGHAPASKAPAGGHAPAAASFTNYSGGAVAAPSGAALTAPSTVANANGFTVYTSRAAFDAAVPGTTVEDFASSVAVPFSLPTCQFFSSAACSDSSLPAFGAGDITDGVVVNNIGPPHFGSEVVLATAGIFGPHPNIVGANFLADDTEILIPTSCGVGFDLYDVLFSGASWLVSAYGPAGFVGSVLVTPTPGPIGTFIGFTDTAIDRIAVTNTTAAGELIGNLTFGVCDEDSRPGGAAPGPDRRPGTGFDAGRTRAGDATR